MKYNLGCGRKVYADWINVDGFDTRADVLADVRVVGSWSTRGQADQIRMIHFLEHLTQAEGCQLLEEIHAFVLKDTGTIEIEMPCRTKCLALAAFDQTSKPDWNVAPFSGVAGIVGDRVGMRDEWFKWMVEHADHITKFARLKMFDEILREYPEWQQVGDVHQYVWDTQELVAAMGAMGYVTRIESPQTHGKRSHRDMRVVAIKAEP